MLYVTTRNKVDSLTAHKVLRDGFAPDGGQFLPMLMPRLSAEQIQKIMEMSFCDAVAHVLNLFFNEKLTGWDVEFTIGRKPLKFAPIGRKIVVAEFWHNSDHNLHYALDRIYRRLCDNDFACGKAKGWAVIAIRVAFLFGIFAQLHQGQIQAADIAVSGKDLDSMIAAWYARAMGLPLGLILCGTNENRGFWDLVNKGQLDTGVSVVNTNTPDMDQIAPLAVERLIFEIMGLEETLEYLQKCERKEIYRVPEAYRQQLGQGIVSSVVGENRVVDLINSVYRTNHYLINPYMAISYGTLQDYRSKTGENRMTLLISESAPAEHADLIAAATGLSVAQIKNA